MTQETHQKVTASHLKRNAYLYVRQSSLRQVVENSESTERQYGLRQRAVALGWPGEQILVIDSDLGQSGASAADRAGFQKLVSEVGLGRAGIVLGLEVSRLARNSTDWHRLLEICALTDTLILDEDGLYDPSYFNDRLLLGLKGTMSEAELHVLRARLRGGALNKAKRGELVLPLPIGLAYDAAGRVILDPDQQVQQSVRLFFATFRRTGSAFSTVKLFGRQGLRFPRRLRSGPQRGEVVWAELGHGQALHLLHNPRYTGAYVFGRSRTLRKPAGGCTVKPLPPEQWAIVIRDSHPGYLTWEEYEQNQQRLRGGAYAYGLDRRHSPPREGPALLQGLVLCGCCGTRMTVRYQVRRGRPLPYYVCQQQAIEHGETACQLIPGAGIDQAIGRLLIAAVTPVALEVALVVQQEIESRWEEADRLRQKQVERARYETELAQRRYMSVDPAHRLVADSLEADWNEKLRILTETQQEYQRQREAERGGLSEEQRCRIFALATDFPRLWQDPKTPDRERKRMVRLMIKDVTLKKDHQITAEVRFRGGAARTLALPIPLSAWKARTTPPQVIAEIDRLLHQHTDAEIASALNQGGFSSGTGQPFHASLVARLRRKYQLQSRYDRLRTEGLLTLDEMAKRLRVSTRTVKTWRDQGLLRAQVYNDKQECLYHDLAERMPFKQQGRKLFSDNSLENLSNRTI
jgi:DNA invertase Pin-like site-specific DNA recombinase